MLRRIVSCSKHVRKASDLLVRTVKRNEGLQPSVRAESLNRRKRDSLYRKNISGRGWQVGTRDRMPYNNSGNREKTFSRHWSFKQQHHSYCFIPFLRQKVFPYSFEPGFSKRNHRSVMLPRHKPVLPLLVF